MYTPPDTVLKEGCRVLYPRACDKQTEESCGMIDGLDYMLYFIKKTVANIYIKHNLIQGRIEYNMMYIPNFNLLGI